MVLSLPLQQGFLGETHPLSEKKLRGALTFARKTFSRRGKFSKRNIKMPWHYHAVIIRVMGL
jgi:hypothetical protein